MKVRRRVWYNGVEEEERRREEGESGQRGLRDREQRECTTSQGGVVRRVRNCHTQLCLTGTRTLSRTSRRVPLPTCVHVRQSGWFGTIECVGGRLCIRRGVRAITGACRVNLGKLPAAQAVVRASGPSSRTARPLCVSFVCREHVRWLIVFQ